MDLSGHRYDVRSKYRGISEYPNSHVSLTVSKAGPDLAPYNVSSEEAAGIPVLRPKYVEAVD